MDVGEFLGTNTGKIAIGAGSALVVGGMVAGAVARRKKRVKRSSSRKKRSSRRTPHTAGKGKDRSTRRIRYTKNGQPYVITKSGKAKFIKRSSAKRSHKQKGGRY